MSQGYIHNNDHIIECLAEEHGISKLLVIEVIDTPVSGFENLSKQHGVPASDLLEILYEFIGMTSILN